MGCISACRIMREYMPKVGTMGHDMMFRSTTIQVGHQALMVPDACPARWQEGVCCTGQPVSAGQQCCTCMEAAESASPSSVSGMLHMPRHQLCTCCTSM